MTGPGGGTSHHNQPEPVAACGRPGCGWHGTTKAFPAHVAAHHNQPERIPLVPVQRDNGHWYRPRKVTCEAVHDYDGLIAAVIVFGTHDADAARQFATDSIRYWVDDEYQAGTTVTGWWRDAMLHGERTWAIDPVRGRAGVWFDVAEARMPAAVVAGSGTPGDDQ